MDMQKIIGFVIIAAALSACGTIMPTRTTTDYGPIEYGRVQSIETVPADSSGSGLGAIAGGVVGGVLGNQIGGGRGQTAATIAGAIGGALVGNELESRNKTREVYRMRVRLDHGDTVVVTQDSRENIRVGDRVRVENGQASRYYN